MTSAPHARFTVHPSPVGDVLIVVADGALVTLHPFHGRVDDELEDVARELGHAPSDGMTDAAARAAAQLDAYFDGASRAFDLPLDWRFVRGFTRAALEAAVEIPYGETAAYGEVAVMAGRPGAARAVGTACARTPFSIIVPVHRVVRADGSIGEYGGRPEVKRFLLDHERAVVEGETAAGEPDAGV